MEYLQKSGLYKGQLKIRFEHVQRRLSVHLIEARELSSKWTNTCNSFVQVFVSSEDKPKSQWTSSPVYNTNTPAYNQCADIELKPGEEKKRLVIIIFHMDTNKQCNEFLGCMSFGIRHLKSKSKRKTGIEGWYYLLTKELGFRKHLSVPNDPNSTSPGTDPKSVPGVPDTQTTTSTQGSLSRKKIQGLQSQTLVVYKKPQGYGFTVKNTCPVRVGRVKPGGPSEEAGLLKGDYISRINGLNVSTASAQSVAEVVRRSTKFLVIDIWRIPSKVPCRVNDVKGSPSSQAYSTVSDSEMSTKVDSQSGNTYHSDSQSGNTYHGHSQSVNTYHSDSQSGNTCHSHSQPGNTYHSDSQSGNTCHSHSQSGNTCHGHSQSGNTCHSDIQSGNTCHSHSQSGNTYHSDGKSGNTCHSPSQSGNTCHSYSQSGNTYNSESGSFQASCESHPIVGHRSQKGFFRNGQLVRSICRNTSQSGGDLYNSSQSTNGLYRSDYSQSTNYWRKSSNDLYKNNQSGDLPENSQTSSDLYKTIQSADDLCHSNESSCDLYKNSPSGCDVCSDSHSGCDVYKSSQSDDSDEENVPPFGSDLTYHSQPRMKPLGKHHLSDNGVIQHKKASHRRLECRLEFDDESFRSKPEVIAKGHNLTMRTCADRCTNRPKARADGISASDRPKWDPEISIIQTWDPSCHGKMCTSDVLDRTGSAVHYLRESHRNWEVSGSKSSEIRERRRSVDDGDFGSEDRTAGSNDIRDPSVDEDGRRIQNRTESPSVSGVDSSDEVLDRGMLPGESSVDDSALGSSHSSTKSTSDTDVRSEIRNDVRTDVRSEIRNDVRTDVRSEIRNDVRTDVRSEIRNDVRTDVRSEFRNDVRTDVRSEFRNDVRTDVRTAIKSLVDTDRQFVQVMLHGVQQYSRPLRHGLLSAKLHTTVFMNIEKLVALSEYNIHQFEGCYSAISSRNPLLTDSLIAEEAADIYNARVRLLCNTYKTYLDGLPTAKRTLHDLYRKRNIREFLHRQSLANFTVEDFLEQPKCHLVKLTGCFMDIMASLKQESKAYRKIKEVVCAIEESCFSDVLNP